MMRQAWIAHGETVSVAQQCVLATVSRATVYAHQKPKPVDELDLLHSRLIDEDYTRHPFYGSRKMVIFLKTLGYIVNRKRVQRLMRAMGLAAIAPGPNTSRAHPEHKIYPYLLRGVAVVRPNQVWSTDITYIRLPRGFVYLVAIIDWYSRLVLAWRISNSMDATFCVDCLRRLFVLMASRRSSTAIKVRSLPAISLPAFCTGKVSSSAWMAVDEHSTIFSLNGSGAASSMRMCI